MKAKFYICLILLSAFALNSCDKEKNKDINLIPDGDFEVPEAISQNWNITRGTGTGYITVLNDTIVKDGIYALYNLNPEAYTGDAQKTYTVLELKEPLSLNAKKTYELSCWIKAQGKATDNISGITVSARQLINLIANINIEWPPIEPSSIDWTYKSATFSPEGDDPVVIQISIPVEQVWIDNVSLKLK